MRQDKCLPRGWTECRIEDVIVPNGTRNPKAQGEGSFRYVDVDAVDNTRQVIDCPKIIANDEASSRARMLIGTGDVIFCLVRPYLKNIAVVPAELNGEIASTAFCVLRPAYGIDYRFLFYQLLQDSFIHSLPTYGNSPPSARDDEFRGMPICIAPSAEQRRIVAKIEELHSDLNVGVAALQRVRANLKRYRTAVLKAAVEGKLTEAWRGKNPATEPADKLLERILAERRKKWEQEQLRKYAAAGRTPPKNWHEKYSDPLPRNSVNGSNLPPSWCWATIDQLTAGDRSSAYGVLQPGNDVPGGVPLVRVCDIADGRVAVEQLKRVLPAISEQYHRTVLQGGEVLLTIVGTIGRTAVAPAAIRGANTARAVAVIPTTALIASQYVEITLRDSSMRARLTAAAHEVARKTLNLEDVRFAKVPLAPLEEQGQIITEVERRLSVVEAVEAQVEHGLKRATRLRQAILKRAFEGKLVPQDPSDEPAVKLLERLSQRAPIKVQDGGKHRPVKSADAVRSMTGLGIGYGKSDLFGERGARRRRSHV